MARAHKAKAWLYFIGRVNMNIAGGWQIKEADYNEDLGSRVFVLEGGGNTVERVYPLRLYRNLRPHVFANIINKELLLIVTEQLRIAK